MNRRALLVQKFVDGFNSGIIPWVRPWTIRFPHNFLTGRNYSGINVLFLMVDGGTFYATYKQLSDYGVQVQKGSKGKEVVFFKTLVVEDNSKKGEVKEIPLMKTFNVFSENDLVPETIPEVIKKRLWKEPKVFDEAKEKELEAFRFSFIEKTNVRISNQGTRAAYWIGKDLITLPNRSAFATPEGFFSTLFHEQIHATAPFLNRETQGLSGENEKSYAFEELVAEIGSAFLCSHFEIKFSETNTQSYLNGWAKAISDTPEILFKAASQAQKAVDFILGNEPEKTIEGGVL